MFSRSTLSWCAVLGLGRIPRSYAFSSFNVRGSFSDICNKIEAAAKTRAMKEAQKKNVQLVVVSKTKPCEMLQEAYDAGAREFGENYIQELCEKAPQLPSDINWHFIGHLQSNKAKKLVVGVPNLAVVESVDSLKLAKKLNNACENVGRSLNIYIQINTSSEDTKSGVMPSGACELAQSIASSCPRLSIAGLMTIGAPGDESCFDTLVTCRHDVSQVLDVEENSLELSMGMSGDFETAILKGSSSVRIGSSIFGARDYSS